MGTHQLGPVQQSKRLNLNISLSSTFHLVSCFFPALWSFLEGTPGGDSEQPNDTLPLWCLVPGGKLRPLLGPPSVDQHDPFCCGRDGALETQTPSDGPRHKRTRGGTSAQRGSPPDCSTSLRGVGRSSLTWWVAMSC